MISFRAPDRTREQLEILQALGAGSITDIIITAVDVYFQQRPKDFAGCGNLLERVKAQLKAQGQTLSFYCTKLGVGIATMRDTCRRVDRGARIRGFGDSNKWRDKQDSRLFRTSSAYIVHCLNRDFGFDIPEE